MKGNVMDWDTFLEHLKGVLNDDQTFISWFLPLQVEKMKRQRDGSLHISIKVPDSFFLRWFVKNYSNILETELKKFFGGKVNVEYVPGEDIPDDSEIILPHEGKRNAVQSAAYLFGRLEPRFTFDTFVVGKSNEFAYAAARAVAEEPGVRYNPLFIYGGVGLGKTHLLNAIGNYIISRKGNRLRVCSITTEKFMNDFIKASLNNKLLEFQNFYRSSFDVLLVDDIHYLEGKKTGTQDQFFHIFNIFFNSRKQIVLTSDKYPQNLHEVQERLKNRFEQGLIVDIKPPEYETKVAIVRKKAFLENFHLSEELAHYLVSLVNADNVRQLEGALTRVIAYASLKGGEITKDLIDEALSGYITQKKRVTPEKIIESVARHFNLKVRDIKSTKRTKYIAFPRQLAMYLCREILGLSFPEIGHIFGGKDHSTVIHSVRKIQKLLNKDPELRELVENFKKKLS